MIPNLKNMNIFYINLKDSLDRKQKFLKYEQDVKRFPAINGKKYADNEEFKKKISLMTQSKIYFNNRNVAEEINSIGAIGCSLSHYFLWCYFLNEKIDEDYLNYIDVDEKEEIQQLIFKKNNSIEDEYLFVIEDDASFDYTKDIDIIQKELSGIINNIGNDWDIYLIDCIRRDDKNFTIKEHFSIVNNSNTINSSTNLKCNEKYCKVLSFFGTHSYIIKKSAVKKIIPYFYPIECHIDAFLGLLAQKKVINIVTTTTKIVTQLGYFHSTINHTYNNYITNRYLHFIIIFVLILIIIVLSVIIISVRKNS